MIEDFELFTILQDWSYWHKEYPSSIQREVLKNLPSLDPDLVWVIQGVRRCGKSTLLAQIAEFYKLTPSECYFINFEDPRLADHLNFQLLEQIIKLAEKKVSAKQNLYFFFDEIQNVLGWEKWLHSQVERPSHRHFIITGSNSSLLGGKLGSALTGRHRTIELFPFNYSEFLKIFKAGTLKDYLEKGGFPRALREFQPENLLRDYFSDIVERDVRRFIATRSPSLLLKTAKAVFESTASKTSFRKLANIFETTADTIKTYVEALVTAYLVLPCPYFTFSERKRAVRPVKYYPIDTGLYCSILARSSRDFGSLFETFVFHTLRRRTKEIYYWQGKGEVDFVLLEEGRPRPIQVTWYNPLSRHEDSLKEFKSEFKNALDPIIITPKNFLVL